MRGPSQVDRIAAWLDEHGSFNEVEFAAPNVADGGPPIQRVAARIYDIKRDRGWVIDTRREKNLTATYIKRQGQAHNQQTALAVREAA
jgi:hypothetical protein